MYNIPKIYLYTIFLNTDYLLILYKHGMEPVIDNDRMI